MFGFSADYGRQSRTRKNNFHHDLPSISERRENPMSFVRDATRSLAANVGTHLYGERLVFSGPENSNTMSSFHYNFYKKKKSVTFTVYVPFYKRTPVSVRYSKQTASDRDRNFRDRSIESEILTLNINTIRPRRFKTYSH